MQKRKEMIIYIYIIHTDIHIDVHMYIYIYCAYVILCR